MRVYRNKGKEKRIEEKGIKKEEKRRGGKYTEIKVRRWETKYKKGTRMGKGKGKKEGRYRKIKKREIYGYTMGEKEKGKETEKVRKGMMIRRWYIKEKREEEKDEGKNKRNNKHRNK